MIKYFLTKSPVSANPGDQIARVVANDVWDLEKLINECLLRGSTLTKPDLRASIELLFRVMIDKVAEGVAINTPLVNMKASIGGVFNGSLDGFDPGRHELRASSSAGVDMKLKLLTAEIEKTANAGVRPLLSGFIDNFTHGDNIATPGNLGIIHGEQLKYDEANPLEGIFFVNDASGVQVKADIVNIRTENRLSFIIPALPAGTYALIVRRAYTLAASIRNGELEEHVSVT